MNKTSLILFLLLIGRFACVAQKFEETEIRFQSEWQVRVLADRFVLIAFGTNAAHMAQVHDGTITAARTFAYLESDLDSKLEIQPTIPGDYLSHFDVADGKKYFYTFKRLDRVKSLLDYLVYRSVPMSRKNFQAALDQVPIFPDWQPSADRGSNFNKKILDGSQAEDAVNLAENKSRTEPQEATRYNQSQTSTAVDSVKEKSAIEKPPLRICILIFVVVISLGFGAYIALKRTS